MSPARRYKIRCLLLVLLFFNLPIGLPSVEATAREKTRPPGVAGSFYPADPKDLGRTVDDFLARVREPVVPGSLIALVSPHAGYPYSGPVAAYAYALLRGRKFSRVVVISPSHYDAFEFSSVYNGDAYSTPLGAIPVDKAFASQLVAASPLIKFSDHGHGEVQGRWEHALEDELPFLQRVLGDFKLVPVVMGDQSYESSRALGVALARGILKDPRSSNGEFDTLIVASSDLSHYHPYEEAGVLDHKTLAALEQWDYFNASKNFRQRVWEACGGGGIVAAMIAAERLGANRAVVLRYANSGDVTDDKSRVVGYAAVALIKGTAANTPKVNDFKLGTREKRELMNIARKSVETAVLERKLYECSSGGLPALAQDRGAFVTLRKKGELRGCIGYVEPRKPLCLTVRDVAALAALRDARFPPIAASELRDLEFEISVLSPLRRVTDWKQIRVGRDGLLVKKGEYEGLLLPEVATEEHWNRTTFLNQVCVKAGLARRCWQDAGTDVFLFTVEAFGQRRTMETLMPDAASGGSSRGMPDRPVPRLPPQ
jgi:AmmeMemoRadiSam system protein B/AmmeMemoRadiSam system protein A